MRAGDTHTLPSAIGKYRVDGVLGRGAMGVVYRAYDAAIDRVVALKTIRTDLLSSEDASQWRERFRREARAAARCLHPNIVTVFEYGEAGEVAFIAMEHVPGRQLLDFLTGPKLLDRRLALSVVGQMLQALDYAHARGIVHRDIKPANVMLLDDGQVKVADFGVARIETGELTQQGAMVGTPRYMSPEQFTGDAIDRRSDLFSVGIILFELLTGQKPFPGRTTTEVMYHVLHEAPRDARALNPEVPAALSTVVRRALARRPEDRYQTAAEFGAALMPLAAAPAGPSSSEPADAAATVIRAPGAAVAPEMAARVAGLEAELLRRVEDVLAFHVGPVAKVLVRKAAAGSASLEELMRALAGNLPTEAEQAEFLKKVRRAVGGASSAGTTTGSLAGSRLTSASALFGVSGTAGTFGTSGTSGTSGSSSGGPSVLSDAELDRARQDLTVTLGPIATVLVRKLGRRATTLAQLYRLLAEHIPGENERAAFLRKAPPGS